VGWGGVGVVIYMRRVTDEMKKIR